MKRTKPHVIHDILDAAANKNGLRKTHLMYKANLSHESLTKYLDEIIPAGLLVEEKRKGKTYYVVTDEGIEYLNEVRRFIQFSEAFGL